MSSSTSTLANVVGNDAPQVDPSTLAASAQPAPNVSSPSQMPTKDFSAQTAMNADEDASSGGGGGSRLQSILSAVAKVGSTALAGVPDKGRSSFVTGLGEGARAENAAQAQQQDIKFKSFDDQVRVAQLHNQDLHLANATQEEQDAHEDHMNKMHAGDEDWGIQYDQVPNDGGAVMDNLKTQTAANGAASVPAGTHISPDGKFILVPKQTPATDAGQLKQYNALAPVFGMPTSPSGATKLDPKVANVFYNRLQGFTPAGDPYTADLLPSRIASNQSLRDELAKNGATSQVQLDALDGIISKQKAQLKANNDQADTVAQRKTDAANDVNNNKAQNQIEVNANKPQKAQSTVWVQGVSADEKKKAELAENMTFNANNIASTLMKRPDLVGAVAGRYTNVKAMAGSNDPDIVALSTDIHNIAMANNGIHGMRSAEAVTEFENKLLNHFKNGPQGIFGGLKASTDSVQTFIDNARPDTYKTHSKQGGAIRAMVPQGQQQ